MEYVFHQSRVHFIETILYIFHNLLSHSVCPLRNIVLDWLQSFLEEMIAQKTLLRHRFRLAWRPYLADLIKCISLSTIEFLHGLQYHPENPIFPAFIPQYHKAQLFRMRTQIPPNLLPHIIYQPPIRIRPQLLILVLDALHKVLKQHYCLVGEVSVDKLVYLALALGVHLYCRYYIIKQR